MIGALLAERWAGTQAYCRQIYQQAKIFSETVLSKWGVKIPPPFPREREWSPKNPEVQLPRMSHETSLSDKQWLEAKFPSFPVPREIRTHVNVEVWENQTNQVSRAGDRVGFSLMSKVLQLRPFQNERGFLLIAPLKLIGSGHVIPLCLHNCHSFQMAY